MLLAIPNKIRVINVDEITVGLPRTMVYYYLYPYFAGFFRSLGIKFVVSPETTQRTLDDMAVSPTDELCVPVKLTFAHAARLRRMGISHLLIPTLVSIDRNNYCCPKFIGLPGMVARASGFPPERVLRPVFNEREKPELQRQEMAQMARALGISDEAAIEQVYIAATWPAAGAVAVASGRT